MLAGGASASSWRLGGRDGDAIGLLPSLRAVRSRTSRRSSALRRDRPRISRPSCAGSEARYRALAEAGALDVIRLRPDGALLSDLPGWRALTGGTAPLCGATWLDGRPPGRPGQRCAP